MSMELSLHHLNLGTEELIMTPVLDNKTSTTKLDSLPPTMNTKTRRKRKEISKFMFEDCDGNIRPEFLLPSFDDDAVDDENVNRKKPFKLNPRRKQTIFNEVENSKFLGPCVSSSVDEQRGDSSSNCDSCQQRGSLQSSLSSGTSRDITSNCLFHNMLFLTFRDHHNWNVRFVLFN